MLDSDVAMLYHYKTKRINETVSRNKERFPQDFCFQISSLFNCIIRLGCLGFLNRNGSLDLGWVCLQE